MVPALLLQQCAGRRGVARLCGWRRSLALCAKRGRMCVCVRARAQIILCVFAELCVFSIFTPPPSWPFIFKRFSGAGSRGGDGETGSQENFEGVCPRPAPLLLLNLLCSRDLSRYLRAVKTPHWAARHVAWAAAWSSWRGCSSRSTQSRPVCSSCPCVPAAGGAARATPSSFAAMRTLRTPSTCQNKCLTQAGVSQRPRRR